MTQQEILKKQAAQKAAELVQNGMQLGLGTGSTANYFIQAVAERIQSEGLQLKAIATSIQSERLARQLHIPILSKLPDTPLDLTVDGADEIDPQLNLIKGLGGALLMEKIVALHSRQQIIIADSTKLVTHLGEKVSLPIEVTPFGWQQTARQLELLGLNPQLRHQGQGIFQTDQGHYILDCRLPSHLAHPEHLAMEIKQITGVVDHGFFLSIANQAIVADGEQIRILHAKR